MQDATDQNLLDEQTRCVQKEDLLKDRPRSLGKPLAGNFYINNRGMKVIPLTEEFRQQLIGWGYRKNSLDYVNKNGSPCLDQVLIHRHRGGFGDLITAKPGICNILKLGWDVIVAIPEQFHFIYKGLERATLVDFGEFFNKGMRPKLHSRTRFYFSTIQRYRVAIDLYCPCGVHETDTNFRPTEGRIRNFCSILEGPPSKPFLDNKHFKAVEVFNMLKTKSLRVGIQFESERKEKDWPEYRYIELANRLRQNGIFPITFHHKKTLPGIVGISGLALDEVAYVIDKGIDIFIGPDSGLLHVAAALGKPTVWLFGPTSSNLTLEFYDNAIGIQKLLPDTCYRPCYYSKQFNKHRCDHRNGDCMTDITIDEVLEAVLKQAESLKG